MPNFDFLYGTGWGAFTAMLAFQIPFLIFFLFIVFWKSFASPKASRAHDKRATGVEGMWMTVVVVLFLAVNIVSIQYIPAISTARAVQSGENIQNVDVTAVSWSYEISNREFVVGNPVRFSAKSADTMHGFAVYHPNGNILFTMMLVPGMSESSLIYTFQDPGTYKVRCLEYCGLAHHDMADELVVAARAASSSN